MKIEIIAPEQIRPDAISIEEIIRRRIARRKRVAKRMMKKWGLFAVEQMQTEFPGYTHEQFNEDLKRKKAGKRKKNRRKKLIGFDYKLLMYHVPWFVRGALSKQKTKIRARFSTKKAVLIVEIHWKIYGEYGEGTLLTGNLIKLLNGSVKDLCEHPNVFVTHIQQHDESIH